MKTNRVILSVFGSWDRVRNKERSQEAPLVLTVGFRCSCRFPPELKEAFKLKLSSKAQMNQNAETDAHSENSTEHGKLL